MSIIYCEKHSIRWDSNRVEACSVCANEPEPTSKSQFKRMTAQGYMSEMERKFADAIIAMVEAGWLLHNEKGMTDAQKKCLEAYILAKQEKGNE